MAEAPQTVIWLIRHPEPEGGAGVCYGALDLKLSEKGVRQAEALAATLAEEPIIAVYTSPLQRCRRAAELVAARRGCRSEVVDDLRELNHGEWEGRTYDEIRAGDPERYRQWMEHPTELRFPGGESLAELRERVLAAWTALRLRHGGETIAVLTHVGPGRAILADALGMPVENMFRLGLTYAGMCMIRYWGDLPEVRFTNRLAYLPGL
jgi:alpha-ribazole phosphatase